MSEFDKAKTDIVYFAEHIMKFKLSDEQKKILKGLFFMAHGNGIYVNPVQLWNNTAMAIIRNHYRKYNQDKYKQFARGGRTLVFISDEPKKICIFGGCNDNYGGKCNNNPEACPDGIWEDNPYYIPEDEDEK